MPEEQYEQQVVAHLAGQRLLKERPNTLFCFTTEQALLGRHFGGPEVTKALLDHLLEQQRRRNMEVQTMPLRQEDPRLRRTDAPGGNGGPPVDRLRRST
ncbi:Scr1 family TA system antitoxin-like transcriptional regulator [Streptomyces antimycoticus]|uniref:Scr1 family TA system antitoxin-like transcriptional regulator n=1 Tax=Streptomyces antimycoticus TaxID=68175 RepID=UPI00368B8C8F